MELENLVKKCVESVALNPNEPTPLSLHQGLILWLYHFHLALCPLKPILAVRIEEIEPPTETNLSPVESKGSVKKSHPVPADSQKPKGATKKLKGIEGAAQTSEAVSLWNLKSTPAKTPSKPTLKKKGKEEKEPPNKGKNVVRKDSLGDTMVAKTMVIGCDAII